MFSQNKVFGDGHVIVLNGYITSIRRNSVAVVLSGLKRVSTWLEPTER